MAEARLMSTKTQREEKGHSLSEALSLFSFSALGQEHGGQPTYNKAAHPVVSWLKREGCLKRNGVSPTGVEGTRGEHRPGESRSLPGGDGGKWQQYSPGVVGFNPRGLEGWLMAENQRLG